jgi:hypothetical protein
MDHRVADLADLFRLPAGLLQHSVRREHIGVGDSVRFEIRPGHQLVLQQFWRNCAPTIDHCDGAQRTDTGCTPRGGNFDQCGHTTTGQCYERRWGETSWVGRYLPEVSIAYIYDKLHSCLPAYDRCFSQLI